MKAVTIDRFGGVEEMHWSEMPIPQPAANEVQIHIKCTAVNPVDWKIREGWLKHMLRHEFPITPGWDAAGTVSAVGERVTQFKIGDEIYAYCKRSIVHAGTYAEYICIPEEFIALKPTTFTFAQAAAIPLVGLTAWQALFDAANLQNREHVLIHGGAGGVGSLAIEFAHDAGAIVYTTASERNHDYVKSLGANFVLDYNKENFLTWIQSHQPEGVDVVIDCIGNETLQKSFDALKKGGRLVSIVNKVDEKQCQEHGIKGTFVFVQPSGKQLKEIAKLIDANRIKAPHIEEMPLSSFALAQEKNRQGHTRGKIVLRVIT